MRKICMAVLFVLVGCIGTPDLPEGASIECAEGTELQVVAANLGYLPGCGHTIATCVTERRGWEGHYRAGPKRIYDRVSGELLLEAEYNLAGEQIGDMVVYTSSWYGDECGGERRKMPDGTFVRFEAPCPSG